jgi:hypothetical protein
MIMYHEIQRMNREGFSISRISKIVLLDWRTVKHYLSMSEAEFDLFISAAERKKELQPCENFVYAKLKLYPDTSAAQMHDWLKEHFSHLAAVSPKTVFNFVAWVRQKYNLPKIPSARIYEMVAETPYGAQAQVDFGFYNMRDGTGKQVKVTFFTMVLSRSRYKFVWFSEVHFTAPLAVMAHELAFKFFEGIPSEIVYDQDRVFISDENLGDIILTDDFKAYVRERSFKLHFCRKADPESKGKIENTVKFIKQNFLYNRPFEDIETLNYAVVAWLGRTANAMAHGTTQLQPAAEWETEKAFLSPYAAYETKALPLPYTLRKDNTISFKGCFYSVPAGMYKGRGCKVAVRTENGCIIISELPAGQAGLQDKEICRHTIAVGKGQKVINTDHCRNKASAINELIELVCALLENAQQGRLLLAAIRLHKPRYIRDHITIVRQCIDKNDKQIINKALDYCCANNVNSAMDFKSVVEQYSRNTTTLPQPLQPFTTLNPLNGAMVASRVTEPAKSAIADYDALLQIQPFCQVGIA